MARNNVWTSRFDAAIKQERERIGKGEDRYVRPEQLYDFAEEWRKENPRPDDDGRTRAKKDVADYYRRNVPSSFKHNGQLEMLLDGDAEFPMLNSGTLVHVAAKEMRRGDWDDHIAYFDEETAKQIAGRRITRAAAVERRNAYKDANETWPEMARRVYGWEPESSSRLPVDDNDCQEEAAGG